MARAPVRLSATVSSAWRQSCGNRATIRPARWAASTVSMNSTVLGRWIAITELAGSPESMKCADSAEMARSACANVRRLANCPVTRGLLTGSISARASGCRANTRRNNPSSVGDGVFWITGKGSSGGRCRSLPPGFREIARQRCCRWPFYPIPARDPLLPDVKNGNHVKAGDQRAVERPHRRDEIRPLPRREQRLDHGVDRGIPGAHVIARTLAVGGATAPIDPLLVARRQRLIQAERDHVEIESQP